MVGCGRSSKDHHSGIKRTVAVAKARMLTLLVIKLFNSGELDALAAMKTSAPVMRVNMALYLARLRKCLIIAISVASATRYTEASKLQIDTVKIPTEMQIGFNQDATYASWKLVAKGFIVLAIGAPANIPRKNAESKLDREYVQV